MSNVQYQRLLEIVRRNLLALSNYRTFPKEDYIDFNVLFSLARGEEAYKEEVFLVYRSKRYTQYQISNQYLDEILIIQLFNSKTEKNRLGVVGSIIHLSIYINRIEKKKTRESIEIRYTIIQQNLTCNCFEILRDRVED